MSINFEVISEIKRTPITQPRLESYTDNEPSEIVLEGGQKVSVFLAKQRTVQEIVGYDESSINIIQATEQNDTDVNIRNYYPTVADYEALQQDAGEQCAALVQEAQWNITILT